MADVIFVMHKAITLSRDSDLAENKGYRYRTGMGDALDSRTAFVVRGADEREAAESEQKLKEAVDRRVAELKHEAAVRRRMEELRREGYGQ